MSESISTRTEPATRTSLVTAGSPTPVDANHRDPFIDPCPAWCQDLATGHAYESFDVDRVHMGEAQCVEHRYGVANRDTGSLSSAIYPPCVRVYVTRRSTEREPRLEVGVNDLAGFELTPAEALALSDVLRELAQVAEL